MSFGAFPYVLQLLSGPPGMTIGATYWQSDWYGFEYKCLSKAMAAGYGYLQWTPTAAVSDATVRLLVTDQQMNTLTITFTVSTSSSTSQFIFVDSVNGNDSTGTGAISAPWARLQQGVRKRATRRMSMHTPCAISVQERTRSRCIPIRTSIGTNAVCELNTSTKPSALMGFPGDTAPTINMTNAQFATNTGGADLFMQGLNPNGYNASQNNARLIWVTAAGNSSARMTFDNNAGATADTVQEEGIIGLGISWMVTAPSCPYTFINNCSESNRESGFPGNNYGGCSFYGAINALVQACVINQPGLEMDGCYYFKSDVENGCSRGNFVSGSNVTHAFSMGRN